MRSQGVIDLNERAGVHQVFTTRDQPRVHVA
jgi:hypothetical protein